MLWEVQGAAQSRARVYCFFARLGDHVGLATAPTSAFLFSTFCKPCMSYACPMHEIIVTQLPMGTTLHRNRMHYIYWFIPFIPFDQIPTSHVR